MSSRPYETPSVSASRPHSGVAERFRFLLDALGLSREDFVAAVDGAISARSLYSVLAGTRKPSKALAVLIERTWGFRAAYLLEGRGEPWHALGAEDPPRLAPVEARAVAFARRNPDNARALARDLELAELWERLFARTARQLGELDACGHAADPAVRAHYPLLAKLVYEECRFAARRFAELRTLRYERLVERLTTGFVERFMREIPRGLLDPADQERLSDALDPVLERRGPRRERLDDSIAALTATLENLANLGSPWAQLAEGGATEHGPGLDQIASRLEALLAQADADPTLPGDDHREQLAELGTLLDARLAAGGELWPRFQRVLASLAREFEPELPVVAGQSRSELEARQRRTLELAS